MDYSYIRFLSQFAIEKKRILSELLPKSKDSNFINLLQIHEMLDSGTWKETWPQNDYYYDFSTI